MVAKLEVLLTLLLFTKLSYQSSDHATTLERKGASLKLSDRGPVFFVPKTCVRTSVNASPYFHISANVIGTFIPALTISSELYLTKTIT